MKDVIKITSVLTTLCVICAFSLAFVFGLAKEKIALNAQRLVRQAITKIAPAAEKVTKEELAGQTVYKLFDKTDNLTAYAFLAEGQGYQGKIKILAVIDAAEDELEGIEIIESVETPGLGAKIQQEPFKEQFKKLTVAPKIEYVNDETVKDNQIQAITGATISSKAVVNILNSRIATLRKEVRGMN